MSRVYEYIFIMGALVAGLSIGLYAGVKYNPNATISYERIANNEVAKPIQDVVISNLQNDNVDISNEKKEDIVQVSMAEVKISPYAKMMIKKKYKKCGHSTVDVVDIPMEIINYTKAELQEKYDGWKIESFDEEEIVLSREINANCEDHYVIKESEGKVFVYKELTDTMTNLIEKLDLNVESLPEEERGELQAGVEIYGEEALATWKENYTS